MPWKSFSQICREVGQLPLRPFTPTEATELTDVLARHLGVNPSEISLAALEATWFTTPKYLEFVMRGGAREARWLVSGRRSPDGKREVIRPDHWAFLTLDIEHQIARDLDGKLVYADLKGAFGNDLTEEEWQGVERQLAPPTPAPVSKAGAEDRNDERPELKQDGRRPPDKRPRNRNVETEALFKNHIEAVIAKAKTKWPYPESRPGINQMARLLIDGQPKGKVEGFGQEAIRKILAGTYKPAKDRGIPGLPSG